MIPPLASATSTASITLNQPTTAEQRDKFDKVTRQFEGILLNTLWSEFQNDPLAEGDDSDAGGDTMRSMGVQAMSTALANQGGIGLASMIEKQLGASIGAGPGVAFPDASASGAGAPAGTGTGGQTKVVTSLPAWNPLKFGWGPADKVPVTESVTEKQSAPNPPTGGQK